MTNTNENKESKPRKARATREEVRAKLIARLAQIDAQEAGTFTPDAETLAVKRVRAAHRKRETLLARAHTMLAGRKATDKSPALTTIAEKIEGAQKRLADLIQSKENAESRVANLPFDIERLAKLLERAEAGDTIDFPADLTPIPGEGEGTDSEKELDAATPGTNG